MSLAVRRQSGTPLTEQELSHLKALALRPDSEIDFSEIPGRFYPEDDEGQQSLPLEDHTLTLKVDAEVAEWLEREAKENPQQINWVLKRAANAASISRISKRLSVKPAKLQENHCSHA